MRKLLLASAATFLAAGAAFAQPAQQAAAPGTVAVHLNGYFQYGFGVYGASTGMTDGTTYKLNNNGFFGDFRLLPGFDGQTLNGIWYGVRAELRTSLYNAGQGKNNKSTNNSTTVVNQGQGTLYVQRAYGYIGTPNYGFARFGQTDSAFTLSQVGVIENFGDGAQFNCDGGACLVSPVTFSPMIFADTSHLYTTDKIVYESPKFETNAGNLSGIIGFEANSNGIKEGYASPGSSVGTNDDSISGSSATRRRNTVDVSATYANNFEGFATKISVAYLHGSPLGNISGAQPYKPLSVYQIGAETSYAGLTVGANIKGGKVNDGYNFTTKGGRDAFGYIVGAVYNIGPYTVGANYFNTQTAGAYTVGGSYARTESQYGVAVGGDYQLAKPIVLFVQYEYGHKHQLNSSSSGNTQTQILGAGATLKW